MAPSGWKPHRRGSWERYSGEFITQSMRWNDAPAASTLSSFEPVMQVVVAEGGGRVAYLDIVDHGLVHRGDLSLDAEISCLDISPVGAS